MRSIGNEGHCITAEGAWHSGGRAWAPKEKYAAKVEPCEKPASETLGHQWFSGFRLDHSKDVISLYQQGCWDVKSIHDLVQKDGFVFFGMRMNLWTTLTHSYLYDREVEGFKHENDLSRVRVD